MAGCSQWQPEKTSNVDKSNNDRIILNSINQTNPSFYQLLEASYADQRTFLNNILEEDFSLLYYKFKYSTDIEEILKVNAPCIVEIENKEISVYFEIVKVTDCIHFTEALQVAFALYFNMNLEYPKAISTTLEMIQRYFLKIHPDSGTKSQKISFFKKKSDWFNE
ncbi:hypothetical protein RN001_002092 [Aquatica leii]|uniref:Uncharacterized protein n=1 Tax=Aquatica leii TaxID=1421715 RepID=A0AAN7PLY6_9COLE|nr:hypothetical protein RN001_002092 [Aquatica leii]